MVERVYCDNCSGLIEDRDDLVTATVFMAVVPYHSECYSHDLKGAKTLILGNTPINGFFGNISTIILTLIAIGWFIFAGSPERYIALIALVLVAYRLYSYVMFERHLEK